MKSIRCALIGDESLVLQCARLTADSPGFEVIGVATADPGVARGVEEAGMVALEVAVLGELLDGADVLFSVANERVLPTELLERVPLAVNFHDGPLPEYGGLGVTTWAIHDGATEHGVTWHLMTDQVDAGDVILDERFAIRHDDTGLSLNARCYEAGLATFPAVLERIRAGVPPSPASPPTRVFGRYDRPLVWIDPDVAAAESVRRIRSLDLGTRIRSRVGAARWVHDGGVLLVSAADVEPNSGEAPGTVTAIDDDGICVATTDGDLRLAGLSTPDGQGLDPAAAAACMGIAVGSRVAGPPPVLRAALEGADAHLARQETHQFRRLRSVDSVRPAHLAVRSDQPVSTVQVAGAGTVDDRIAAVLAWWARSADATTASFVYEDAAILAGAASLGPLVRPPLGHVVLASDVSFARLSALVAAERADLVRRGAFLSDLVARDPGLRGAAHEPALRIRVGIDDEVVVGPQEVVVSIPATAGDVTISARVDPDARPAWDHVAEQVAGILAAAVAAPDEVVGALLLVSPQELAQLECWNQTGRDHDRSATLDALFVAQVASTPDAPAVTCADRTLTYAELADRAAVLAARLRAAGVGPGALVGIAVPRSADLVIAVLAVLTSGAAYVPLDPEYPEDRLRFMVDDADLAALIADAATAERLGTGDRPVVDPATDGAPAPPSTASSDTTRPQVADPAYVIYTSGSTGLPKGVVIEHRNVTNFFVAMDDVIGVEPPGTWLAVTSLSFDISVLELLWTLTRGFHVVLQRPALASAAATETSRRVPTWSLFYFAAGHEQAAEGYRLLLESARFADANGFEAVWLPERHFHDFGGAYPNPSVAAAAVAAITDRIGIRAGSVVLPLHATPRVAEEWAFVDNLSGGRVGLSFAPGWQPRDFVLNPAAHGTARADLERRMGEVRSLWRGDPVELPGPDGEPIAITTLPRPVQPELPVWLTSAGTTSTFEQAGRLGMNLLTHLLGQSIEQLSANVAVYRRAWRDAGHPGEGHVTLMLHTYLDEDPVQARVCAEGPMKAYLSSASGLIKNMASAFPTFANAGKDADEAFRSLSAEEMDQLLTMAAERYMETSGLFGTVEDAAAVAEVVADAGADEIACLIDFGVATDDVLESLHRIDEARRLVLGRRAPAGADAVTGLAADDHGGSAAGLIERHAVTHLQCTPSLAEMLVADPDDRAALSRLAHLLVGGEVLPVQLARELRGLVGGRLTNMYGPTETTIWSLVHEVVDTDGPAVPIGRPIANTTVHVLDAAGAPLPIGARGELHIGGEGVARGYLDRAELTESRFVDRAGIGRTYATGDLASFGPDGVVEFGGRADFQVKIRGHRIELGEIDAMLDAHPEVDRAVVVSRGTGGDARLLAFVRPAPGQAPQPAALLAHLRARLPAVMVPDAVGILEELPLTPNGKIDRKALPDTAEVLIRELRADEEPSGDREELVASAWSERLGTPIGRTENVFDAGGNSLLAVAVFRHLQTATGLPLVVTDLFRHPTVVSLAGHLDALASGGAGVEAAGAVPTGRDRGARRRQARSDRRGNS